MKIGDMESLSRFKGNLFILFLLLFSAASAMAQQRITGTVTDGSTSKTLPGVNIKVKGTTTGASTDSQGHYEVNVQSMQDTLIFSFVGYQTKTVSIGGRTTINVILSSQVISGQEMVVVGYGTQQKANLTGSVSQISSEEIETQAVNNTTQALQGVAPGLNVSTNGSGGASDASVNLNIRGTGSLSSSNPYILIDGVRATQAELSDLNPNDIKSVSVLKDAAAAAIYGAHAAYGVILVKTKEGAKNGFRINYSNNFRFSQLINVPSTVSSVQFAKVANEASLNYGGQKVYSDEQISKMQAFINGEIDRPTAPLPGNPNAWMGIEQGSSTGWQSGYANTDWWDVMFKDTKMIQKHNISVSGGSDNISYYVSGGLLNDPGQLKYGDGNENYDKYNLNTNLEADVTKWFKITSITRYSQVENSFPNSLSGEGQRWRTYHDITRLSPMTPYKTPAIKDDQGNVIVPEQLAQNASFAANNGFNKYTINNLVSTLKAELDLKKNLSIKGDFSFKRRTYNRIFNYKKWTLLGPDGKPSIVFQKNNNQIQKDVRNTNYYTFNIRADYNKTFFDDHNFKVLVGYQQEENNFDRLQVARKGVIANNLNSVNVAVGDVIGPNNPLSTYATLGAFGRLQYNYRQKYLVEFNGRYDGSSKFAPDSRFVFSPSVSVGYNIDKEDFWDPVRKYVDSFKLRASYGSLGNQDVSSYLYLSNIPIHTRLSYIINGERPNYTTPPGIISPNITWETSTTKNIGADLAFLNNRLSASVDIYERDTENMFGPSAALPDVLGTSPPRTNSASLKTTGWELSVGWQDEINNEFSYNFKLLLSDNQSTITAYNNPNKVLGNYYVGQKLGEIWGFGTDGLFQSEKEVNNYLSKVDLSYLGTAWQPGDLKYRDLNNDGKVDVGENTLAKPGDRKVIGNNNPRYQFSVRLGASWKNFDFNMF